MAFGRKGQRKKNKSLEYAELLFRHPLDVGFAAKVFKGDVIWDPLLTGGFRLRRRSLQKDREPGGEGCQSQVDRSVGLQARLVRFEESIKTWFDRSVY
jgi:hypothetical protein